MGITDVDRLCLLFQVVQFLKLVAPHVVVEQQHPDNDMRGNFSKQTALAAFAGDIRITTFMAAAAFKK